jgi:hypothetical protein
MRWSDLPLSPPARTLRQFAGLWLLFFLMLACWQGLVRGNTTLGWILAGVGVVAGLPGLLRPELVRYLFVGSLIVTFPIGWVVSFVLLAVLFYGLFTPLSLGFRLFGRDPLALRRRDAGQTYWTAKPAAVNVQSYFNQY